MSRLSSEAVKAWRRNRWLMAPPRKVVAWAEAIDYEIQNQPMMDSARETLEDVQEASEWWVSLCRMRLEGMKEKHCIRVLSLPAHLFVKDHHRQKAQDFVDATARWRSEIADVKDGVKHEDDAD